MTQGTRLTIVIETPYFTPDELRQAVASLDAIDSYPDQGIAPENVTAWDIVQYVCAGELSLQRIDADYTEGDPLPDLRRTLNEHGGDMHKAFDGVVVNEIGPLP